MSEPLCFIDSNIWLYYLMLDPTVSSELETRKRTLAISLINDVNGVISTQVINEVCSVLKRKASFTELQIKQVIESFYSRVAVVELDSQILIHATELRTRYSFSFWDGLIVASALSVNTDIIYSEDMQDSLLIEGKITIINPLK
ncbi:MAG: PIN domain-containing protein [Richelia sp. RM2_1_2]|nr:PIN domain-containing protein [Richelia sp. RM2_1_2]